MKELNIRKAKNTTKDIEEIQDLWGEFSFVHRDGIKEYLKHCVVLENEEKIIGILVVNKKKNKILMLCLKKKYRGQGWGKVLLLKGCKMLNCDLKKITLKSATHPFNSLQFWEKMGFQKYDEETTKKGKKLNLMRWKDD